MARWGGKSGAKGGGAPDLGRLLLRLGPALLAMTAGYPVLFSGPRGWAASGAAAAALARIGEPRLWGFAAGAIGFVGGLLLALGLGFRVVAWGLAVAALAWGSVAFTLGGLPAAVVPLAGAAVCAGAALLGAGRYSLDPR